MDWKLYDVDGEFIQDVNCQYDSCDISLWNHRATKILVDFENKTTTIVEKEADIIE